MTFIDVHCHLDMCKENADWIIKKSGEAGVGIIVSSGVNPERNRKNIEIAEKHKEVKLSLGIYPIDALSLSDEEFDSEIDFIRKRRNEVVWIGEVGLDFKESQNKGKQEENFQKLIDLAFELEKPVLVHSRKAELECIEMLEKNKAKKVIMHCFSGKLSLVKRIIENGWLLSIPTNVKHSEHFQKVIEMTPIEQLLCETDSPFLHPDKERNNIPANVVVSYEKIAEIKGISLKEAEEKIEGNYRRLIGN